jgi:hypothetical protein
MNPGTHDSVYDEAVVAWLDNATEHARANAQAKLLYCLECVRSELIQMKHEAGSHPIPDRTASGTLVRPRS